MRSPNLPKFPLALLSTAKPIFQSSKTGFESLVKGWETIGTFPALDRAGARSESFSIQVLPNLKESATQAVQSDPNRFPCVLIEEGLGNFGSAHFYTGRCIASGVPIFEGKKAYADHPSTSEMEDRPERSVRDVVAHFENLKATVAGGRHRLEGDIVVMQGAAYDWVRDAIRNSVEYKKKYPDKDLIALSINAFGDAQPVDIQEFMTRPDIPGICRPKLEEAESMGIEYVNVVDKFSDAISCDLVTEPGAGGKFSVTL